MNLYAWTTNDSSVNIKTVYTLSGTPSSGDSLYDSSGNVVESIDNGSFETRYVIFGNYDAQNNSFKVELLAPITQGGHQMTDITYTRDSSKDILEPQYVSNLSDGTNTYIIKDANAIHPEDVVSTYSSTGTDPVNGIAVASAINGVANTDLSNISSSGKNIGNWSTNITNCVVEIPQDIKIELSSGTLTLKAGSKVYVKGDTTTPTYTISSDKTATQTTNGSYFAFYDGTNLVLYLKTTYDYTTLPSTTSLPIAEITVSNGAISSIDQIFNGIGYIGSHVFFLPGYSVLTPNGRNADGTLKNIKYTFTSCSTFTRSLTGTSIPLLVRNNGTIGMSTGVSYDPITNQSVPVGWAQVGTIDLSSGVISNLNIKMVFRSVDYSEFMNTVGDIETLLAQV